MSRTTSICSLEHQSFVDSLLQLLSFKKKISNCSKVYLKTNGDIDFYDDVAESRDQAGFIMIQGNQATQKIFNGSQRLTEIKTIPEEISRALKDKICEYRPQPLDVYKNCSEDEKLLAELINERHSLHLPLCAEIKPTPQGISAVTYNQDQSQTSIFIANSGAYTEEIKREDLILKSATYFVSGDVKQTKRIISKAQKDPL